MGCHQGLPSDVPNLAAPGMEDLEDLRQELRNKPSELLALKEELGTTRAELSTIQKELAAAKTELEESRCGNDLRTRFNSVLKYTGLEPRLSRTGLLSTRA